MGLTKSRYQVGKFTELPITALRPEVHSWRVDSEKRNQLKRICRENKWGDDMSKNKLTESIFKRSIFNHLYPNQDMPSDHPPVMAVITFEL